MGRRSMLFLPMKNQRLTVLLFALLAFPATFAHFTRAQTVSPSTVPPSHDSLSLDKPGQPSSDSSKATEQMGPMGSGASTEITPEGYLRTGFEEMMFFSGVDLEPVNAHIRTLGQ